MPATRTKTPPSPWIGAAAAARLTCHSARVIRDLARRGLIRAHEMPGVRPLYSRADVEKFIPPAVPTGDE